MSSSRYDNGFDFKQKYSFEKRCKESINIKKKYPTRCPIICDVIDDPTPLKLDKKKYLVPYELTVGQFLFVIRKHMNISQETAIFIFTSNGMLPPASESMQQLYNKYVDEDGFLYLSISSEKTFG